MVVLCTCRGVCQTNCSVAVGPLEGPFSPPPHTTSTLPSTPEAPAISQSPAISTCSLMTLPSFHGSTGVMRQLSVTKTKELVGNLMGTKVPLIPISIQGSIADTVRGVHPGNKLEWAKNSPGFSKEVLQRLLGDVTCYMRLRLLQPFGLRRCVRVADATRRKCAMLARQI